MYIQGRNPGLGDIDWNSVLKDVVGGYTAYKAVSTQADIAKMQLQQQQATQAAQVAQQQKLLQYQLNPQYSGNYGGAVPSAGSSMMPILLIGGAAVLLLMLMKG